MTMLGPKSDLCEFRRCFPWANSWCHFAVFVAYSLFKIHVLPLTGDHFPVFYVFLFLCIFGVHLGNISFACMGLRCWRLFQHVCYLLVLLAIANNWAARRICAILARFVVWYFRHIYLKASPMPPAPLLWLVVCWMFLKFLY